MLGPVSDRPITGELQCDQYSHRHVEENMRALLALLLTVACCFSPQANAQDHARDSRFQSLLGPTVFDLGVNRDGFRTYVVHGYVKNTRPNEPSGSFQVRVHGLVIDHVQVTLTMNGVTGPVTFASVSSKSDPWTVDNVQIGSQIEISYKLDKPNAKTEVAQFQYTAFFATKEMADPAGHLAAAVWFCHPRTKECGQNGGVAAIFVIGTSGKLRLRNEVGGEIDAELKLIRNPQTGEVIAREIHVGWGNGKVSPSFDEIEWELPAGTTWKKTPWTPQPTGGDRTGSPSP